MRSPIGFVPLLLAAGVAAQGPFVSPGWFTSYEGETALSYPLSGQTIRYQQVHDDLRVARTYQGIGWRRDGDAESILPVARTVEIELSCAAGDVATFGLEFAKNYAGAAVTVFDRRKVNLPDRTPNPPQRPMPFDVQLAFDRSYAHPAGADLLWELRLYSSTAQLGEHYLSDAAVPGVAVPLIRNPIGAGCFAVPGNPLDRMRLEPASQVTPAGALTLGWHCHFATPRAAAAVVLVGTTNPALVVPGLCSGRLWTDAALHLPPEQPVSAAGTFRTPPVTLPWSAGFAGLRLYAQAITADPAQSGLPFAASNGLESVLPASPPAAFRLRRLVASSPAATTGYAVLDGGVVTQLRQ